MLVKASGFLNYGNTVYAMLLC